MSTDRATQVRALFHAALEVAEPARDEFLANACADVETRQEVAALIAADAQSTGFLEPPTQAAKSAACNDPQSELIGREIAAFKIVRLIGAGGMGTVYEAIQHEPRRRVALKLMRPGLGSGDLLRRFKLEADILGRLRHPGIAQVFHAGQHETSGGALPYFVMEFVEGARSLTDYARHHQLGTRDRIGLFAKVCDAVVHGHQRGVIHRDLKPGNILIDESGQPKVIDFGVARLIDSNTLIATLPTQGELIIGTLQYMSPEQSAGPSADIDVRTDVYALGVVLYELLAGELPFDFSSVSPFDVPRVIREREPQRITRHCPALRGDVEKIVHKALARDRERRYASVADLAGDLRRHLSDEPIEARRDSGWYVMRKTLSRHRVAAAVVASFLLLSTVSAVSLGLLYQRSERRAEALRRSGYFNSIALAHAALEDENGPRLAQYLDTAPADLRGWEWDYLARLVNISLRSWQAHDVGGAVSCSPDGKKLLSWSYDGTIQAWRLATGDRLATFHGHEGPISKAVFSPDGHRIASVGYDRTLRLWDAQSGELISTADADSQRATSVAYARDGSLIATGGYDHAIKLWDVVSGQPVATWCAEHSPTNVVFAPDGKHLYSSSADGTLSMWSVADGRIVGTADRDGREIISLAISPTGDYLGTGTIDQEVVLWQADSLTLVRAFRRTATPLSVAFSPDGRRLGAAGGAINVWGVETGQRESSRIGPSRINSVAFSPDGTVLVSADTAGVVRLWDAAPHQAPRVLSGHTDFVRGVVVYPDGSRIASASRDGSVRVWDVKTGEQMLRWEGHGPHDQYLAMDPRGRWLVSCGHDAMVRVWDAETGAALRTLSGHRGPVSGVACSPDGHLIASTGADGTLRIWDAESGSSLQLIETSGALHYVRFAPDSDEVVTTGWDGFVRIWSLPEARERLALGGHEGLVIKADFSPNGQVVASAGSDSTVRLWDVPTGQPLQVLRGHDEPVQSLAFTRDGKRLFSGGYDNLINLWDVASGTLIMTLAGHRGGVTDLAMGPGDDWLVSCSNDQTLRIWRARSQDHGTKRRESLHIGGTR